MSGLSTYSQTNLLNALLRGTNFTAPTVSALRLALCTADPTQAGGLNEVGTGTWYTRMPIGTFTAPSPSGSASQCSNVAAVTFPAVTGAAVTITFVAIYDNTTAGNMLFSAPMTSPKTLQIGDVLSFAPGTLVASMD
jgi:hypothetical protein